jgi:hypothetical protein
MISYLEQFKKLAESGKITLYGDNLLVERISEEDSIELKGADGQRVNFIIAADTKGHRSGHADQKPMICRILLAGQGYYDPETGETTPLDLKPGAIVEVPAVSLARRTTYCGLVFADSAMVGYVGMNAVLAAFESDQAYLDAKAAVGGK